ncbi:MAG: cobalamin-dependent protein [Caloramator sp.]|nr:cobalamin-dependent protein [Caloramator sp.]
MNIVLASLNSKYIHSNLAIRYIKSYCSEYNIKLFEATINENILDIVERINDLEPDVIGFSCYIWNIENTLKVCSTLKKTNENLKIILGGPEVSFDGESLIKKFDYIDYIIEGEGEITFKELIDAIFNNENLYNVKGIVFKDGEKIIKNESRQLIQDLNILPFPYRDEIPDKIVYYESSRGCPCDTLLI